MMAKTENIGAIYILSNPSLKGMVKIGWTTSEPKVRAAELSASTSIPTSFFVEHEFWVENPQVVEKNIFQLLKRYRINPKREFFKMSVADANQAIGKLLHNKDNETEILLCEALNILRLHLKYAERFKRIDKCQLHKLIQSLSDDIKNLEHAQRNI